MRIENIIIIFRGPPGGLEPTIVYLWSERHNHYATAASWKCGLNFAFIKSYTPSHSELFCLFSFGNWKFENLPISSPLCIKMFFRPYIFVIQSKKVYRLSRTLIKIAFNSGGNCFFAYFSIFSLVSQGRYLVKSHICGILWRK